MATVLTSVAFTFAADPATVTATAAAKPFSAAAAAVSASLAGYTSTGTGPSSVCRGAFRCRHELCRS